MEETDLNLTDNFIKLFKSFKQRENFRKIWKNEKYDNFKINILIEKLWKTFNLIQT
jgi:hypothetical protein